jgi:hypothetical protein
MLLIRHQFDQFFYGCMRVCTHSPHDVRVRSCHVSHFLLEKQICGRVSTLGHGLARLPSQRQHPIRTVVGPTLVSRSFHHGYRLHAAMRGVSFPRRLVGMETQADSACDPLLAARSLSPHRAYLFTQVEHHTCGVQRHVARDHAHQP